MIAVVVEKVGKMKLWWLYGRRWCKAGWRRVGVQGRSVSTGFQLVQLNNIVRLADIMLNYSSACYTSVFIVKLFKYVQ